MNTMSRTMAAGFMTVAVAVFHGCDPNCTMYVHADKIMARQTNVVDCGTQSIYDTAEATDRFVACVNNAIQTDTPFRAEPNKDHPGIARVLHIGRRSATGYELFAISWVDPGTARQYVSAGRCIRPGAYAKTAFGPGFTVNYPCPEHNRVGPAPMQPVYNPPESVPNGALCGVQY